MSSIQLGIQTPAVAEGETGSSGKAEAGTAKGTTVTDGGT